MTGAGGHGLADPGDVTAFLDRLVRLDPHALVRLRPAAPSLVTLWARLPWGVLVGRTVHGGAVGDVTVGAGDLLAELRRGGGLPPRRDQHWRWPLPTGDARAVETIPAGQVRELADSAATALRSASTAGVGGRPVGERALRDALLDHVPVVVTPTTGGAPATGGSPQGVPARVEVSQRLVQAVARMGFLGRAAGDVRVLYRSGWIGLAAEYGTAWLRSTPALPVRSK